MRIDLSQCLEEFKHLQSEWTRKGYNRLSHFVRDRNPLYGTPVHFYLPEGDLSPGEVISLHLAGAKVDMLSYYILFPSSLKITDLPQALSYSQSVTYLEDGTEEIVQHTWSELVERESPDGMECIGWTANKLTSQPDSIEDLHLLLQLPDVRVMTRNQYQAYTHDWHVPAAGEEPVGPFYTIERVDREWHRYFADYKQAREKLKELMQATGGFTALNPAEQKIAARWFICSLAENEMVLSMTEGMLAAEQFNRGSIKSRETRLGAAVIFVRKMLVPSDWQKIQDTVEAEGFLTSYVQFGKEGTMQINYEGVADPVGLFDYVLSTPGTRFETTGLVSSISVPKFGFTVQQIIDKVMDILKNGNY